MTDTRGNPRFRNENDILARFRDWDLDGTLREYLRYHAERYVYLLQKVTALAPCRVMDIGISFQTELMRDALAGCTVDTFGFEDHRFPSRAGGKHIPYDLNHSQHPETWPAAGELYDAVVMAEVIEHLHTAARPVLVCVAHYLRPGGALVLQTPNAVSLGRRTSVLRGNNPFSMIREDKANAGHFCEFTTPELCTAVESAGLNVVEAGTSNYFGAKGPRRTLYDSLCGLLPGDLHDGITLIARKPEL